jgi:hypothetical protein
LKAARNFGRLLVSVALKRFGGRGNSLGDNFICDSKVEKVAKLLDEHHGLACATFKLESREDSDCSNRFQPLGFSNLSSVNFSQ